MATLITGGTGFVGRELCKHLGQVVVTSRRPSTAALKSLNKTQEQIEVIQWNAATEPLTLPKETRFESVVNLMGESIAEGRWNTEKKNRILASRVKGTRGLVSDRHLRRRRRRRC